MSTEKPERSTTGRLVLKSEADSECSSTYLAMDLSLPTITGTISTDPLCGGLLSPEAERELQQLFQASEKYLKEEKRAPDSNPDYVETCLECVNRALGDRHQLTLKKNVFYTLDARGRPDASRSVTGEKSPLAVLRNLRK